MIKSLSSLRFIFAIMVFMVHIKMFNVAIGHAFFIILSGFILSMVYEERLLKNKISPKGFFKKRLVRIWPLHIVTLLAAVPLNLAGITEKTVNWFGKFFINMFFLQTLFPNIKIYFSFNGVSWNAADLMIFYALFPVLVYIFHKITFKGFTLLMIIIVVIILVCMLNTPKNYHHYIFYISPFFRIFDFIFGMYLYKVVKNMQFNSGYSTASLAEIGSILLLVICFLYANNYAHAMQPFVYSIYLWMPLSIVISVFYFEKGVISQKLLNTNIMVMLGGLSYSFYMVHHLVIRYVLKFNTKYIVYEEGFTVYFFCFVVALVLAYLLNKYFEKFFIEKFSS